MSWVSNALHSWPLICPVKVNWCLFTPDLYLSGTLVFVYKCCHCMGLSFNLSIRCSQLLHLAIIIHVCQMFILTIILLTCSFMDHPLLEESPKSVVKSIAYHFTKVTSNDLYSLKTSFTENPHTQKKHGERMLDKSHSKQKTESNWPYLTSLSVILGNCWWT